MKLCLRCGHLNEDATSSCFDCGVRLEDEDKGMTWVFRGNKWGLDKKTMKCAECGADNHIDALYCSSCGKPLKVTRDINQDENGDGTVKKPPKGAHHGFRNFVLTMAFLTAGLLYIVFSLTGRNPFEVIVESWESGRQSTRVYDGSSDAPSVFAGMSSDVGALINGGHVACDDSGHLYFAVPVDGTEWDTRKIVKSDSDGSNPHAIFAAPDETRNVYHLTVVGDRIVFNQIIEGRSSVVAANIDGSASQILDRCDDWSLCQVDNGWVYYLKDGTIWRCDVYGDDKSSLRAISSGTLWRISGDKVFMFPERGGYEISMSNLDGTDETIVFRTSGARAIEKAYPMGYGNLVVLESNDTASDTCIRLVNVFGGTIETPWQDEGILRVCDYDRGLLLTSAESDGTHRLHSIDFTGRSLKFNHQVNEAGYVSYTCVINGRAFYGLIDDALACSVYSVDLSTGVRRQIAV